MEKKQANVVEEDPISATAPVPELSSAAYDAPVAFSCKVRLWVWSLASHSHALQTDNAGLVMTLITSMNLGQKQVLGRASIFASKCGHPGQMKLCFTVTASGVKIMAERSKSLQAKAYMRKEMFEVTPRQCFAKRCTRPRVLAISN